MATAYADLNSEPSLPEERTDHHLPPKSYAAAVSVPLEEQRSAGNAAPLQNGSAPYAAEVSSDAPAANGHKTPPITENKELYEQHSDRNRHVLTSVKQSADYEVSLKHDQDIAPRKRKQARAMKKQDTPSSQLKTGRRAGAGWERSA